MFMLLAIALILYYATLETYLFLKSRTSFKNTERVTELVIGLPGQKSHKMHTTLHLHRTSITTVLPSPRKLVQATTPTHLLQTQMATESMTIQTRAQRKILARHHHHDS